MRRTALAVIVMLAEVLALAQTSGGGISGKVVDALGGAIPDSTVRIENQATGETRASKTNAKGFYSFPNLTPGRYNASVSRIGFGDSGKRNLSVEIGEQIIVDFELEVGAIASSVEVASQSQEISLTSSTLTNVVGGQTVRDLPLNGRDWTLLASLEPGVHAIDSQTAIAAGSNSREDRGWGTEMTVGGGRPQQNNYRLDGISINDFTGNGPGNVLGSVLGTDAIQEFSVVTGIPSADYGKTSAGVINAVTRAGSNRLHGSAYEFLRNSAMDARNFFDASQVPPFRRNQFGATLSGPIRPNRSFFFFNYEGLRQNLSSTTITTVPSRAARSGQLLSGTITIDPKVVPYLQIFPLPNGSESGDTGIYSFIAAAATSVTFSTARLDHAFSDRDTMHGSFLVANSKTTSPDGSDFVITGQISQTRTGSVEETHIFGSNLLNIIRVGVNRAVSEAPIQNGVINPLAADTSLGYLPGTPVGGITITGLTSFNGGVGGTGENDFHFTSWQVYDDIFYTRGAHSVAFGIALERIESNEDGNSAPNGRFSFGSLQAFLTDQPQSFNSTIPGKSPAIYLRQFIPAFYVRDDYRVLPNLTLNLGIRYEIATVPSEKYDRLSNLDSLTAPGPKLGSPYFQNPTVRNFSPRIGFAWDPFRSEKTSVRGGFGIYDTLPLTYQFELLTINVAPFFQTGTLTALPQGSFPAGGLSMLTANSLGYAWIQPNPKRSYVEQWNVTIQRQLPGSVIATLGYSGQHGLHQPLRTSDTNLVLPEQTAQGLLWPVPRGSGSRLNRNIGAINSLAWLSSNSYEAGNAAIAWEHQGVRIGGAYTFAKSIDDSSSSIAVANFNNSVVGSFIFDPSLARGLSDFDVRQSLVLNATWLLPRAPTVRNFVRWAVNQWQLGGIFRASTGLPFTPVIGGDPLGMNSSAAFDFPDRLNLPGCNNPVNNGNATHYIKTQCFAPPQPATRLGDSGRNIAIGPGLNNLELAVFKNNYVHGEKFNIQFRAEVFNVLNHTNFAVPDRTAAQIFTQTFSPVATAGLLKTTSTTSRQIQLALKCIF